MWRSLSQLPALLIEIAQLLREQCLLLREFHQTATGRASQVPPTPGGTWTPPSRPLPSRKLQASDVQIVTREERLRSQAKDEDRRRRPWAGTDLDAPPPETPPQ